MRKRKITELETSIEEKSRGLLSPFSIFKSSDNSVFVLKCSSSEDANKVKTHFNKIKKFSFNETVQNFLVLEIAESDLQGETLSLLKQTHSIKRLSQLSAKNRLVLHPITKKIGFPLTKEESISDTAPIIANEAEAGLYQLKLSEKEFAGLMPILEHIFKKILFLFSHSQQKEQDNQIQFLEEAVTLAANFYRGIFIFTYFDLSTYQLKLARDLLDLKIAFQENMQHEYYLQAKNDQLDTPAGLKKFENEFFLQLTELSNIVCPSRQTNGENFQKIIKLQEIERLLFELYAMIIFKLKSFQEKPISFWSQQEMMELSKQIKGSPRSKSVLDFPYNESTITQLLSYFSKNKPVIVTQIQSPYKSPENFQSFKFLLAEKIIQVKKSGKIVFIPLQKYSINDLSLNEEFTGDGIIISLKQANTIEIKYIDPHGSLFKTQTMIAGKQMFFSHHFVEEDIILRDFEINNHPFPITLSYHAKKFLSFFDKNFKAILCKGNNLHCEIIFTGLVQQSKSEVKTGAYLIANFIAEINNQPRQKWDIFDLRTLHLKILRLFKETPNSLPDQDSNVRNTFSSMI